MDDRDLARLADIVAERIGRLGYTVPQAAEVTGIGRETLYRLINAVDLRVLRIGRRIVISREALERLLQQESIA